MDIIGTAGERLGSRYRLVKPFEEQWDSPHATQWYAVDDVLATSVRVFVLNEWEGRSALVDAARRAALINDGRVVQILSVADSYVVTEIPLGTSLLSLTRGGALPAEQAASVTGEIASIVAELSLRGIRHLALTRGQVRIGDDDAVYLDGVGTSAALLGVDLSDLDFASADKAEARGLAEFFASLVLGRTGGNLVADAAALELPRESAELLRRAASPEGILSPGEVVRVLAPWGPVDRNELARAAKTGVPAGVPSIDEVLAGSASDGAAGAGNGVETRAFPPLHPTDGAPEGNSGDDSEAAGHPEADDANLDGAAPDGANSDGADVARGDGHSEAHSEARGDEPALPAVGEPAGEADAQLGIVPTAPVNLKPRWHTPGSPEAVEAAAAAGTIGAVGVAGAVAAGDDAVAAAREGAERAIFRSGEDPTPTAVIEPVTEAPRRPESLRQPASAGKPVPPASAPSKPAPTPGRISERRPIADRTRTNSAGPAIPPAVPSYRPRPAKKREPLINSSRVVVLGTLVLVVLISIWAINTFFKPFSPVDLTKPTITAQPTDTASAGASGSAAPNPSTSPTTTAPADPPAVVSARLLNPKAKSPNDDFPNNAGRIADGNPGTVYSSYYYLNDPHFGLTKDGMGFEVRLAKPAQVSEVHVNVIGNGGTIQWRNTDAGTPTGGTLVASAPMSQDTVLKASQPITTDHIVLWVTSLPTNAKGRFQLDIAEVTAK